MTPELQQLINAQQQAAHQAQFKMYFMGYTTYAAIMICAVFAVLIFWKLCQIQKKLPGNNSVELSNPFVPPATPRAEARSLSSTRTVQDDSRFMPK